MLGYFTSKLNYVLNVLRISKKMKKKVLNVIQYCNVLNIIKKIVSKLTISKMLTILLYGSTIVAIVLMLSALEQLKVFELDSYRIEINGQPTVYASYIMVAYIITILSIPLIRICMTNMHKYLHYLFISINLLISNFTIFSLPKFIQTIKDLEIAQADTISIGRWITIRKLWPKEEIMRVMNGEISSFAFDSNCTISEEQRATILDAISKRQNIYSMQEARHILTSQLQKLMVKPEPAKTPTATQDLTWSQWLYECKVYFTYDYYYIGWFVAGAAIIGTGYGIYKFVKSSGNGGSGGPDGPNGPTGGKGGFSGPRGAGMMETAITPPVSVQEAVTATAVTATASNMLNSTINNVQNKKNESANIPENTSINKQVGPTNETTITKNIKHKYEGDIPEDVKLPSFGFQGMINAMLQSTKEIADKTAKKINNIKELIMQRLNFLKKKELATYDNQGNITSMKFKDIREYNTLTKETKIIPVKISAKGEQEFEKLASDNYIEALTTIATSEKEQNLQLVRLKYIVTSGLIVEKEKTPNIYAHLVKAAKENNLLSKRVSKLEAFQKEVIAFITEIVK